MESRDSRDKQRKHYDDRKRSFSPVDDKSLYRRSREDAPTKRSRSGNLGGHRGNDDDDDLRNVLTQYQKSKWDDDEGSSRDRKRYNSKDRDDKRDGKSEMFTSANQRPLMSLSLEPLSERREHPDSSVDRGFRDKNQKTKDRERRDSRDYSSGGYSSSKQNSRGGIDDRLRALSGDHEGLSYDQDTVKNALIGELLHNYGDSSLFESSSLSIDNLREISLTGLAGRASDKYRSNFELGRPFFGFSSGDQGKEQGLQDPKFGGKPVRDDMWEVSPDSLLDQRGKGYGDSFPNDDYLVQRDGNETMKDQLGGKKPIPKAQQNKTDKWSSSAAGHYPRGPIAATKISSPGGAKSSSLTGANTGPKPLIPSGFLPRQVKVPFGKNSQKTGLDKKGDSPPQLPRKSGYFPRTTDVKSRSQSRSSERDDIIGTIGDKTISKREDKPPGKGTFTTQNWSGLETNENEDKSKVNNILAGSIRGRGGMSRNNQRGGLHQKPLGRGDAKINNQGKGKRGKARGGRGRGIAASNRGRGISQRGRGTGMRGRGRGLSQRGHFPAGATVRNIFRKSTSLSPAGERYGRSSRSPGSSRRSRSRSRNERKSRSRSSSYCSTCSSGSCSTCYSWGSISLDGLSGKGRKENRRVDYREKRASKEEFDRKSEKTLEKLKADIEHMEKQLDGKKVLDVPVKKPLQRKPEEKSSKDLSKSKLDPKSSKDVSRSKLPPQTTKDMPKSKLDPKTSKDGVKNKLDPKTVKDSPKSKSDPKNTNDLSKRNVIPKTTKDLPKSKLETRTSKDEAKSKLDSKTTKDVPKSKSNRDTTKDSLESKSETKSTKSTSKVEVKVNELKDKKGSLKEGIVREERSKSPFESKRGFKKTDSSREVIFKSDKRKESPLVVKKQKDSPAREVKIVSDKKNKSGKALDEQMGSKMKVDSLKITIDQPERVWDGKNYKKIDTEDERSVDERKRSSFSKSPPAKQKKKGKEKLRSKKAKKKSKKRKQDRGSSDSEDDSVYSSLSEFSSSLDERSKYLHPSYDERIVEFSSGAYDSNRITVHYAKGKRTDPNHPNGQKLPDGEGSKMTPHPYRRNLIAIPLPKEPDAQPAFKQNVRSVPSSQMGRHDYPPEKGGKVEGGSDALRSEVSYTGTDPNVDWETGEFTDELHTGDQDHATSCQGIEGQEWVPGQEEGDEYYYQEGVEGEGYEEEYYWQASEQAEGEYQEGEYQEWFEEEYAQEGAEGEVGAEYEGQYYLGEDGLYYPVEEEAYEGNQGEYYEGGAEGEVVDPEQGVDHTEEEYAYHYAEEGAEWQQYEEGAVCETEEGWAQGEVEGQWEEYQEGYSGAEAEWGTEYAQDNEYEVTGQEYAAEVEPPQPDEKYVDGQGQEYDQQPAPDQYYAETYPPEEIHQTEPVFQPEAGEESMEPVYNAKDVPDAGFKGNVGEIKPLKSILKKSKYGQNVGTKLVSERLAQVKNQATSKIETPWLGNATASSTKTSEKVEQNPEQGVAADSQSESEKYREMEEAIFSSQPKDAIGTEYVVRLHESGTANFFCQLCKCHFNTLTAKNLHVKGMKHIELYIRLKSSLLQSVIKGNKTDTSKRPADEDPSAGGKVSRRF